MAWRLAKSLDVLRAEVRSRYPGTTFWTIGDEDHQNGYSDHNPNSKGVVCAADILDDGGMDLDWFAEFIRTCGHPDLDYVIWRDKIADAGRPWQRYRGAYHGHVHVSVGDGPDGRSTGGYDSTTPWGIARTGGGSAPTASRIARPTLRPRDSEPEVGKLQRNLNEALALDLLVDNDYGPQTTDGVRLLQRRAGITEDGIYGRDSAAALRSLLEDDMALGDKVDYTAWYKKTYGKASGTVENTLAGLIAYGRNASDNTSKLIDLQEAVLAKLAGADTKTILDAINARAKEAAARDAADAERDAALLAEVRDLASGGASADQIVDKLAERLGTGE